MCGILGFALDKNKISQETFSDALEMLHHRGPDHTGISFNEDLKIAMGHKRLAIVDLSINGAQPMSDPSKKIQIIFNGEIYNYQVLRDELALLGCDFRSKSDTEVISSSRIRALVVAGKVEQARELLSRPHRLDGVVIHGEKRGREIGYPTANLGQIEGQTIPADGVYAGWLTVGINFWPAAISIGTNPTFEGERGRQVEAYALDQEGLELYDKNASIEFGWFLRPTLKFDGLDDLLVQMKRDCDQARELTEK